MLRLTRRMRSCPVCGTADCNCKGENEYTGKGERAIIFIENPLTQGTSRGSGVFANERIFDGGFLLYAVGSQISVEDVERLGIVDGRRTKTGDAPARAAAQPAAEKKPSTGKVSPRVTQKSNAPSSAGGQGRPRRKRGERVAPQAQPGGSAP